MRFELGLIIMVLGVAEMDAVSMSVSRLGASAGGASDSCYMFCVITVDDVAKH